MGTVTDVWLTVEEVMSLPVGMDLLNSRPWTTDWRDVDQARVNELVETRMPEHTTFFTSGSTGEPKPWQLHRSQMLAEVRALATLLSEGHHDPSAAFDGVLAFAPPRHRFGAHCSVLLPAALNARSWVRPRSTGRLPAPGGRWLIVAIPSTFSILLNRPDWLRAAESVTILHSSARLPAVASELAARHADDDVRIIELLGSTESGAVATRDLAHDGDEWRFVPGVSFADPPRSAGSEAKLSVRSPWLARHPGEPTPPQVHELGDVVQRCATDQFRLLARAGRFVKVNGVRHHLDDMASRFAAELGGREVACVGIADARAGEHFELYVVDPDQDLGESSDQLREAINCVGLTPRRVRLVTELVTSSTGKIVHGQSIVRKDGAS